MCLAHANETLVGNFSHPGRLASEFQDDVRPLYSIPSFYGSMPDDNVIVKFDFSNAFNCLHRDVMLERDNVWCPRSISFVI